jgi:hypothetical protein
LKTTLLFLSVFISANLFGQNVNIPDANFKAYLVGNTSINTNGDTEIQVSEASAFTGVMNCSFINISDLTGIEAFTAITQLNCWGNELTSLDVSSNTALTVLYCDNNQLTSLDVSSNTALTLLGCWTNQLTFLDVSSNNALNQLSCFTNQLTSLDVSSNTALTQLDCGNNQLTSLDVSNCTALTELDCYANQLECLNVKNGNNTAFETFIAYDNQNLTCIDVDDVNYSTTNWTIIDPQTSFSTNCNNGCSPPPIVNIPDANFKAYLAGNTNINTNGDSEIQVSEASAFTGEISCIGQSISDLTGIEAFTALTELDCGLNNLTSLDLFNNAALEVLYCDYNELTSLDLSTNTALTELRCGENQLEYLDVSTNTTLTDLSCSGNNLISLDVSSNTALTELRCDENQLESLDVSINTSLTNLFCDDNQLTSLDVSSCTALTLLWCKVNQLECLNVKNGNNTAFTNFNAEGNQNLTCIEVDDVNYSTANWTDIDSQTSFSIDCDDDCDDPTVGINELTTTKSLIQILDMMGRETSFKPNTPLIYVYDDGSIEKVFSVEY